MSKTIIIGSSFAGHNTALSLRAKNPDMEIAVLSDEPHRFYDRNKLVDFISGAIKENELYLIGDDFYIKNKIIYLKEKKIIGLNTKKKSYFN